MLDGMEVRNPRLMFRNYKTDPAPGVGTVLVGTREVKLLLFLNWVFQIGGRILLDLVCLMPLDAALVLADYISLLRTIRILKSRNLCLQYKPFQFTASSTLSRSQNRGLPFRMPQKLPSWCSIVSFCSTGMRQSTSCSAYLKDCQVSLFRVDSRGQTIFSSLSSLNSCCSNTI